MAAVLLLPRLALAHAKGPDDDLPRDLDGLWRSWELDPATVIGLVVMGVMYTVGLWRMWRTAGIGHGIKRWEAAGFLAGWVVLTLALISPLHPLGEVLFSAHMVQHELLMLVAAPLLVLGRPIVVWLRALPAASANGLGRFSNTRGWIFLWGLIAAPFSAWLIHAIVLWGWHAPALFQATLTSNWVHAAQHISFLGAAILFWWAVIHGHAGVKNDGGAVLYLFTTAIHSGLLGALLTFSRTVWYPAYDDTADWGLTGLEDQQLGGLVMWVPACSVYIIAGLYFVARWLRSSDARLANTSFAATPLIEEGGAS